MTIDDFNGLDRNRKLKAGYTSGTCATAAAKAAVMMLLTESDIEAVQISTPIGVDLTVLIEDILKKDKTVSCAVRKYSGDDPDVTDGMLIYAKVSIKRFSTAEVATIVSISGGKGIGKVTKPGLDRKLGDYAINSVPRRMITEHVREVMNQYHVNGKVEVQIYAPEGERVAKKTFNPRLGITNGISILGTTGIVTPMSKQALIDTVKLDIHMHLNNDNCLIMVPGNYGIAFAKRTYGIEESIPVEFSNYIGEAIDLCVASKATGVLLIGHLGKFVKLAGGIMNTHSKEADARLEILTAHAVSCGIEEPEILKRIVSANTTEEAVAILKQSGKLKVVCQSLAESMYKYASRRAGDEIKIGIITYTLEEGELARSGDAEELIKHFLNNK